MGKATRKSIIEYALDVYSVSPDFPWADSPGFAVLRHNDNKKWFGVIMDISPSKIGLQGDKSVDVMNIKCDPLMIGSLIGDEGFYPAYHMNKNYWVTVLLDGSLEMNKVCALLDMSFELTSRKAIHNASQCTINNAQ